MAGGAESHRAFRDLLALLLNLTVLRDGDPGPRLWYAGGTREQSQIGGLSLPLDPLPIRDGRYLRVAVSLYLDHADNNYLKVAASSFQYQVDSDPNTDAWVFRYDYLRQPTPQAHPSAHLQVNADLIPGGVLPSTRPLRRIHFPTRRVPLEGTIRLLAEEFGVECAEPSDIWRPALSEAEQAFASIAHEPPLGP
jgi:hypothetical protein